MQKHGFVFLVSLLLMSCAERPPADAQLLAIFDKNKAKFESLRNSLCQRAGRRIVMMDPEWSEPQVSTEEKKLLYDIFREIGVSGVYYDGDCSFRLPVWAVGFAGDGDYKYYVYRPTDSKKAEALTAENLDEIDRESMKATFYLKPIGHDWYIAFDHWP